ncbi:ferritin-like domain-containing protein [Sphingomonas sp. Leaf17]|uniref:ferritin-like domain-containing protein n=1 Tax=Sphingomonas sp. Leaf17 TaxID=1735683 RepID=UPI00138F6346|nr:ferritin-like domain-containing protein [Sphingomonas sp. Leaf17]
MLFKAVAGSAIAGAGLLAPTRPAAAQTIGDIELLNLILNMEYLLAQFLSQSVASTTATTPPILVPVDRLTGNGVAGVPIIPGRGVTFSDPALRLIVNEMAADNRNHLLPIRVVIGALAVRQPLMDISASATAPFAVAMQRAGVVAPGAVFDPYANEENLLYAILYLKSISVAAYRGLTASISNRVVVQNFTGFLGAEAIHAATIRSYLYSRGATTPRLRENAERIAAFQRSLNGGQAFQGVAPIMRGYAGSSATVQTSNVSPAAATGEAAGRSAGQVLNQLYLTATTATSGGFFPEGVNGTLRTSASA